MTHFKAHQVTLRGQCASLIPTIVPALVLQMPLGAL